MNPEHDDPVIARLWRGVSAETPDMLLDVRILNAAHVQQQRRRLVPLAAALAACLVLALYALQMQSAPRQQAALPDTSTFGLYEGRAGAPLADSEAMQQMIRQQPGGSAYSEIVYP
jgi:hypothetical protein